MSDIPVVGGRLMLMSSTLDDLETVLHGWRWIRSKDGLVVENPTWNKHCIISANRNGDAITVDGSTAGGKDKGYGVS